MKHALILGFIICFKMSWAHAQERFVDQTYADVVQSTHTYSDTLKLDFYTAREAAKKQDRPIIIVVHGGGFSGGKRTNPLEVKFSETMAKKGYAVASISYTLTRKGKETGFGCNCPASEKMETFRVTSEDILKSIAFLENNTDFAFDSNKIILLGSSAGAEGILNTAYLQHHSYFKELPYQNIKIAAVVSLAGAVVDARYIQKDNAIPAFLIHGKKDNLVPYATSPHHYCDPEKPGFLLLDGSQSIAKRLKELDSSVYLVTDPEGNHDWSGLGYRYVEEIAKFIKNVVVDSEKVQIETTATIEK